MICKKCGAKIDDGSAECSFCGAVLKEPADAGETNVIEADTVNEAAAEAAEAAEEILSAEQPDETEALFDENERKRRMQLNRLKAEKQQQLDEIERRRSEKKKRQKRNRIVTIIIIILALGGIGGGVYYLSQNQNEPEIVVEKEKATEAPVPTVAPEEETEAPEEPTSEAPTRVPAGDYTGSGGSGNAAAASGGTYGSYVGSASGSAGAGRTPSAGGSTGSRSSSGSAGGSANAAGTGSASGGAAANTAPAAAQAAAKDYSNVAVGADGCVFGDSASRLLTESDLAGKSADELRIARNEIYARHGRKFKDASLQNYFNNCSWYSINSSYNYSNDAANLNSIEQANAKFILQYEKSHR